MDCEMHQPKQITLSRYCMFLIFSYADYAPKICTNVRLLNRKYNLLATKDYDALSLLVKRDKIFLVRNDDEIT